VTNHFDVAGVPGVGGTGLGDAMVLVKYRLYRRDSERGKGLESLAGSQTMVTVRGQLYKKPAGKKKADASVPLKLLLLEVQKKE
jgi:hypothetical protein